MIALPVPMVDADELDWKREQALAIISVMSVADECKSSAIPEQIRQTLYAILMRKGTPSDVGGRGISPGRQPRWF